MPLGFGPPPFEDSPDAFVPDPFYAAAALSASPPSGYQSIFTNKQAANQGPKGYLGWDSISSYHPSICAAICNAKSGCSGFNIYFERDPVQNPGPRCLDPSSTTLNKCAYWGVCLSVDTCTNTGQLNADFNIVIAGCNGYTNPSTCSSSTTTKTTTTTTKPIPTTTTTNPTTTTTTTITKPTTTTTTTTTTEPTTTTTTTTSKPTTTTTTTTSKPTTTTTTTTTSISITSTTTAASQCTAGSQVVDGRSCTIICNADRPGGDTGSERTGSLAACVQACADNPDCLTAQYHEDNDFCYFKGTVDPLVSADGVDTVDCEAPPLSSTTTTTKKSYTTSCTTTTFQTSTKSTTTSSTTTSSSTPTSTCFKLRPWGPSYLTSTSYLGVDSSCGKLSFKDSTASIFSLDVWGHLVADGHIFSRTVENWFDPFYGFVSTEGLSSITCSKQGQNLVCAGIWSESAVWTSSKSPYLAQGNSPGSSWDQVSLIWEPAACPSGTGSQGGSTQGGWPHRGWPGSKGGDGQQHSGFGH